MSDEGKELKKILEDRGDDYGDATDQFQIAQLLKSVMATGSCHETMPPLQQEAIDMICTKLSRIAQGNPRKKDTWMDIAGYATLVAERLYD